MNLSNKKLGNKIFEYLNKINFISLSEIDLSLNKITEIKSILNNKFSSIANLNLCYNKIEDINELDKSFFPNLITSLD